MLSKWGGDAEKVCDESLKKKSKCLCGVDIKCTQCQTKSGLKALLDRYDPSLKQKKTQTSNHLKCTHPIPEQCKQCASRQKLRKIVGKADDPAIKYEIKEVNQTPEKREEKVDSSLEKENNQPK